MAKAKRNSTEAGPLDAAAWSEAALDALAVRGIDGVRVEVLATALGVTKGSFYWHFKDRDALFELMLADWRKRATLRLIERLDRGNPLPADRLRRLLRLPITGERSARAADVELAVRLWGRSDLRARAALEEVDRLRLRYIAGLIEQHGTPPDEANARAVIAYAYMRVAATLVAPADTGLIERCEALLIGSRDGHTEMVSPPSDASIAPVM